jgi:hypothetical protein
VTETIEALTVDLNATVECATTRAVNCPNDVEWYSVTICCDKQVALCDVHAKQGMAEWDDPLIRIGFLSFTCGYCNAAPMPRPTWRKI